MIDVKRRQALALNLRHLSVGLISNDDFESNVADTVSDGWLPEQYHRSKKAKNDDAAIAPILELSWGLYSDLKSHKLKGKDKLTDETLRIIARCILFLRADLEYQWPQFNQQMSIFEFLASICSFGLYYQFFQKKKREAALEIYKKLGDYDYWPFFKVGDYEVTLVSPPYLTGLA
jgi:hypothetical protein